jgi:predicted ATP-binding protein involved in virulence
MTYKYSPPYSIRMRVKKLYLKNFKRFTELTINELNPAARAIVLVGENGSGKSCVFDGFEQIGNTRKGNIMREDDYLRKDMRYPWHADLDRKSVV